MSCQRLACDLLNAAARDTSWRSRFLITFLALDVLLERRERPEAAQRVIAQLRKVVETSDLNAAEKARLMSALGNLRTTSLAAEIERFASLGANATHKVQGERLPDFLEACLKLRHKLAHPPASNRNSIADGELSGRVNGLTQVVLGIIWSRNNLPPFSVNRPRDIVRVSELQISVF